MAEPQDLTIHILRQIQSDIRDLKTGLDETREELHTELNDLRVVVLDSERRMTRDIHVIGDALKLSLRSRKGVDARLDDHEQRLAELERNRSTGE